MSTYTRHIDADGNLKCSKCKIMKSVEEFSRDIHARLGRSHQCKQCRRETVRESYRRRRKSRLAAAKQYRDENRDKLRDYGHSYYQKNKEYFRSKYNSAIGRANKAVQTAVRQGNLPRQDTQYCIRCQEQAQQYHHQSYLLRDRLCVVPVCLPCHHGMNLARHDARADLGVFPTRAGLVRIAIAFIAAGA